MFLPREKKILNMLLKNERKFTTAEIAAELKVDSRTIKMDIKKMNEELEKNFCYIRTRRGVGLWLDYNAEGEKFLKKVLYETQDSYISSDVRKYYVAAELLNRNDYIAMETLANLFYVSKATVLNDVNELENFWKTFGLVCTKKVKYGVLVEGSEKQIRRALFDILKCIGESSDGAMFDKIQPLLKDVDLLKLKEIIEETEKRFNFALTELSFDEFLIRIAILLHRVLMNEWMEEEKVEIKGSKERKEWFVVQFLRNQIEEQMECKLPDSELAGFTDCLKGLRYQVPMIKVKDKVELRKREPEMFDYMMEVFREIDEKYLLELEQDEELICALFSHLEGMFHRIQSKMYLVNPLLKSVKREMFYEYEIASVLISRLNDKYGIEANEDEIGYITFHIGASIERNAQLKNKTRSVTLVCMSGIGTSQFLSVKMKRIFPNLEIKKIIPSGMAGNLKKEEQDFIISTVPLEIEDIDVVQVSLVLNDEDILRIQKYLKKKESFQEEEENQYSYLKTFWHEEITILGCDLKSKEEAIRVLGNRMVYEGYVDEGYVDSIFDREKISDTSLGSLLAIPHAFEGHILKEGIGLLTLKKPVVWGKEKVQVVFMLALNANSGTDFQKIFKAVFHLTRNFKDVDKILKATSLARLKGTYL